MAMIKCKMCGGDLDLIAGQSVAVCEYCGSRQTVPAVDDERKISLFARANGLRAACEFDKAAAIYEAIVADFPQEAEAYWGLVLCKYGIEYVDDPATGRKIPTCHRTIPQSLQEDDDYKAALDNSDSVSAEVYQKEAADIDAIQKKILAVVAKEAPYDVFICYKETDDDTLRRTDDSADAQDIYTELSKDGYRVFFSRITLKAKAGSEYEPYIYAALSSAKVMLVIGSKEDYFNAVWVKNEWARFLDMMKRQPGKVLIPCYKNIDAYDMPREFRNLQALDMSDMMFYPSLKANLERAIPKQKTIVQNVVSDGSGQGGTSVQIETLLNRAQRYLEQHKWSQAAEFADKALDFIPEYADAYLVRLMSTLQITQKADFTGVDREFDSEWDYKKYLEYAPAYEADLMRGHAQQAKKRSIYSEAMELGRGTYLSDVEEAIELLEEIAGWEDADEQRRKLMDKRKDIIYNDAGLNQRSAEYKKWQRAIQLYTSIAGWKDADVQKKICEDKCADYTYNEAVALKESTPEDVYRQGQDGFKELVETADERKIRDYNAAIDKFRTIIHWKDSEGQIILCENAIKDLRYADAEATMNWEEIHHVKEAMDTFISLGDWRDSQEKAAQCRKNLYVRYKKKLKKIQDQKRAVNNGPLTLLLIALLAVVGVVMAFTWDSNSFSGDHPVIYSTIYTLLLSTPLSCTLMFVSSGTGSEPADIWPALKLKHALVGYAILVVPVFVIWGILNFLNAGNGLIYLLTMVLNFLLVVISVICLGCCVSNVIKQSKSKQEIADYIAENEQICAELKD